ncbi:hypothetical protein PInf_023634 [Phytophthora infestans]|nr:hypothetical protein PInf_023634 [Phytophthora infestans]
MKTFSVVLASILSALTMATYVPVHAAPPVYFGGHPKYVNAEGRVLMDGGGMGGDDDIGDDIGDAGGIGAGGLGGLGGMGGIGGGMGGVGDMGGADGFRALRGVDDTLEDDGIAMNGNDEVAVAGGRTVVRGGAVVARPGPRRWYY